MSRFLNNRFCNQDYSVKEIDQTPSEMPSDWSYRILFHLLNQSERAWETCLLWMFMMQHFKAYHNWFNKLTFWDINPNPIVLKHIESVLMHWDMGQGLIMSHYKPSCGFIITMILCHPLSALCICRTQGQKSDSPGFEMETGLSQ